MIDAEPDGFNLAGKPPQWHADCSSDPHLDGIGSKGRETGTVERLLNPEQQREERTMTGIWSTRRPATAERVSNLAERRIGVSRRRFGPLMTELESRQLLSGATVVTNADSGPGSLRAAIETAVPGEVITFARSLRGQTIALASPLVVGESLTITGFPQGPTISGNGSTEIFTISSGVSVSLNTLKLANGNASRGGAIDNAGNLSIKSSVLLNNQAIGDAATAGSGGAIFNESGSSLTLVNTRLTGNLAIDNVVTGGTATGGAIQDSPGSIVTIRGATFTLNQAISNQGPNGRGEGGAIANTGATLAIAGSRFASNSARGFFLGESGAIGNRDGSATITNCIFTNNLAAGTGAGGYAASGAVTNVGASPQTTTMTIRSSQFLRNQAIATAGGDGTTTLSAAFGGAMGTSGTGVVVNVSRSSFIGNQAIAAMPSATSTGNLFAGMAVGGAIENDTGAILSVSSSVITGNRARGGASGASGSGGAAFGGGIGSFMGLATLNVTNTSVAGNSAQGGGGTFGDGLGGGIAVFQNGRATLNGVSFAGNRAAGASSADGSTGSLGAGGALLVGISFGSGTPGFIFPDGSSVVVTGGSMAANAAFGGAGTTAGNGEGGAIDLGAGNLMVQKTLLAGNTARGGTGSTGGQSGDGSGGGAFAAGGTSLQFQCSSIIANLAAGGSVFMGALGGAGVGGGLYIQTTASVFLDSGTLVIANSATTQSGQIFGPYQRT